MCRGGSRYVEGCWRLPFLVKFVFVYQKGWEEPIDLDTRKIQKYESKSHSFFQNMFDLVGSCLCFHTSGFSIFYVFQFSDFQEISRSHHFKKDTKKGGETDRFGHTKTPNVSIKRSIVFQKYV